MGVLIDIIKVILVLLLAFLMLFPMMPFAARTKKLSTIHALKYETPHNRKNAWYLLLALLECVGLVFLVTAIDWLVEAVLGISFINNIVSAVSNKVNVTQEYITGIIFAILINIIAIYAYAILKGIIKAWILDPAFKLAKKPKKKKKKKNKKKKKGEEDIETPEQEEVVDEGDSEQEEKPEGEKRVIVRSLDNKTKEEVVSFGKKIHNAFWGLFFEKPDLTYAKDWVVAVEKVLQGFVYFVEILYTVLFLALLSSIFFALPEFFYNLFQNVLKIQDWYLYPFISLIFLQELCNVLHTKIKTSEIKQEDEVIKEQKQEEKELDDKLRALHLELQKRFDAEHCLRYYPAAGKDSDCEYVCTNRPYSSSLNFIQSKMKEKSGRIVQSYMECLDSAYNDKNVYLCASLYSELGEYLMHYVYTRLLAGSRLIFVLSDKSRVNSLRKYISDALTKLTGATDDCTWRVYTTGERLDQADVLVATADDFKNEDIVSNYPTFFEEVCNAIFVDADRLVELQSYLCPIISIRLQKATNDRIRFIFLSQMVLRGFTSATLPRYFCVDEVFGYSNANESQAVTFTLWNKESKRNVIYNKYGQNLAGLETIIGEEAVKHGVDGVRIITSAPLNRSDKDILAEHNIEINEFHKPTPNINYIVYSDDKCNLSAALYTSTRFRGIKKSVVHILSHPYLLREYFIDRILSEEYVNRSSFIQPRVTEYADRTKLSFLKVFCEATSKNGMNIVEFEDRMKEIITLAQRQGDISLCPYCAKAPKLSEYTEINVEILAAYLLAALCDGVETKPENSIARSVKDYYIIVDASSEDGYTMVKDKFIVFKRVKDVFNRVFEINERVKLCINDNIIGELDTFPSRVNVEYITGQSIVFNNMEYEIGQISKDRKTIYLRHENVTFKNCFDTIFLRRYKIDKETTIGEDGVFSRTKGYLKEIRVSMRNADFRGETYGFYSLLSDCQTLNFKTGAQGNLNLSQSIIDENARNIKGGKVLRVSLLTRDLECNDKMRLLLSAVFNEFIKTIFPKAYRTMAICPVLENPLSYEGDNAPEDYIDRVKSLYPYLYGCQENEDRKDRIQLIFFNDCVEDVGILQWFYDRLAHYMHEFLSNVYSYLVWLKYRPTLNHYIYFGEDCLPECFDLENCCKLLEGYNLILSESGAKDYETAHEVISEQSVKYCSFCASVLESGRFVKLDDGRYICADCDKTSVMNSDALANAVAKARQYLDTLSERVSERFGTFDVAFFDGKFTKDDCSISQIYYRVDFDKRVIYVQKEMPDDSIVRSIVRGVIQLWQQDNELQIPCSNAQLEYEELCYLDSVGKTEKAKQLKAEYDGDLKYDLEDIINTVCPEKNFEYNEEQIDDLSNAEEVGSETQDEVPQEEIPQDCETTEDESQEEIPQANSIDSSFAYLRKKLSEMNDAYEDTPGLIDDTPVGLYDPDKTPRFWKRLLKGESLLDGEDELSSEDKTPIGGEENPIEDETPQDEQGDNEQADDEVAVTEDDEETPADDEVQTDEGEQVSSEEEVPQDGEEKPETANGEQIDEGKTPDGDTSSDEEENPIDEQSVAEIEDELESKSDEVKNPKDE